MTNESLFPVFSNEIVPIAGPAAASPPEGQAFAFDWPAFRIHGRLVELSPQKSLPSDALADADLEMVLRLTVAIDLRREVKLEVIGLDSGQHLGSVDLSWGTPLQTVELRLTEAAARGGVGLRTSDGEEVYLFGQGAGVNAFEPHLQRGGNVPDSVEAFLRRLCSGASLTQFGWMEGCVLDALGDLGAWEALDLHLDHYFTDDGMSYEDFHSRRCTEPSAGETTHMFAMLAKRRPDHPAIDAVLRFFEQHRSEDSVVFGGRVVAEHNLNVAYPLSVIGAARGNAGLMEDAVRQLRERRDRLDRPDGLFLRSYADGQLTYRHWGRGVAWYLLGMVRTLIVIDEAGHPLPADLLETLPGLARRVTAMQRGDGLWHCFLDEPASGPETSGSAGIAAAIALGVGRGWMPADLRESAERCVGGLKKYVRPDGLLDGMSPSNKPEAGPEMQRSGRRVMGGAAAGLFGQLLAALGRHAGSL